MLIESLLLGSSYYTYKNWDKIKIKKKWKEITFSQSNFTNKLGKTLKIHSIKPTEYGYIIKIELPYSYTKEDLEKDINIFKEGLRFQSIQLKSDGNIIDMYCVNSYKFKNYPSMKLPPNKLLIAEGLTEPIVVDMNKFPHVLIGGETGTGKSRILLLLLTNLIKYCDNVELYLLQTRKNDLGVFQNCKQVKVNSKTLEEVLQSLKKINDECIKREKLIDNTKGYYNIEDYNNNAYSKLKYIYVVIEEFSFLNISRGDIKEERRIKSECLKYVKSIVNVGRSSGVFLITSLQKPTNDSIPSDIKAQLCTRISLKISDSPTAIVVMGNDKPTKLQEREVLIRTIDEKQGYSYTIDHELIIENIKHRIVEKKNVASVETKRDILDILNALN